MIIQWRHHRGNIEHHLVDKTRVKIAHLNYFAYLGEWFIACLCFSKVKPCNIFIHMLWHSTTLSCLFPSQTVIMVIGICTEFLENPVWYCQSINAFINLLSNNILYCALLRFVKNYSQLYLPKCEYLFDLQIFMSCNHTLYSTFLYHTCQSA